MSKYRITHVDAAYLTACMHASRITDPLRVEPPPYKQSGGFRSSSLSGCLRQVGYRLLHYPVTHDTYNGDHKLAADMGTALHTRIQEQLVGAGLVVMIHHQPAIEVAIPERLYSGHIDAIIQSTPDTLAIFDLKSVAGKYLTPRYMHYKLQGYAIQVHAYMAAYRLPDGAQITDALVLMMSRDDTSKRVLLHIPWQPDQWVWDEDRVRRAHAAVARKELPVGEPSSSCRWCSYRKHCAYNTYHE